MINLTAQSTFEDDQIKYSQEPLKGIQIIDSIGSGTFSNVYKGFHKKLEKNVAVKVVPKDILKTDDDQRFFRNEIKCLLNLNHPNVVECYEVTEDDTNYYIIMEFLENGTLLDYINEKRGIGEQEARNLFRGVVDAFDYLHNVAHIIHRDIKLENIMICHLPESQYQSKPLSLYQKSFMTTPSKGQLFYSGKSRLQPLEQKNENQQTILKLIDFGFARNVTRPTEICKTFCGSIAYTSPEMITESRYTMKTDIWSLGVVLYAMVTGKLPFMNDSMTKMMEEIISDPVIFPNNLSQSLMDLITHMLAKNDQDRYDISEVKYHPWMLAGQRTRQIKRTAVSRSWDILPKFENHKHMEYQEAETSNSNSSDFVGNSIISEQDEFSYSGDVSVDESIEPSIFALAPLFEETERSSKLVSHAEQPQSTNWINSKAVTSSQIHYSNAHVRVRKRINSSIGSIDRFRSPALRGSNRHRIGYSDSSQFNSAAVSRAHSPMTNFGSTKKYERSKVSIITPNPSASKF